MICPFIFCDMVNLIHLSISNPSHDGRSISSHLNNDRLQPVGISIGISHLVLSACMAVSIPEDNFIHTSRDHSVHMPSQWETMLHYNVVSHCLGVYTEWSLDCGENEFVSISDMFQGSMYPILFTCPTYKILQFSNQTTSMALCKTAVTPLLMQWSLCSFG